MGFKFERLKIPDVISIELELYSDQRGFFIETYKEPDFQEFGIKDKFVQDNHSRTAKMNVLRGLHYQLEPMAQAKIIRVIKGKILDVVLDLRKGSATYGKWLSKEMSSENYSQLYIPKGFAHGYLTLTEQVEVVYKLSNIYSSKHERGIIWSDPKIAINWPVNDPIISQKDSQLPPLEKAEHNFIYKD